MHLALPRSCLLSAAIAGCLVAESPGETGPPVPEDGEDTEDTDPADACDAARDRLDECQLALADSLYQSHLGAEGCADACVAACVAEGACDELDTIDIPYWDSDDGCSGVDDTTGWCADRCNECNTPLVLSFDGAPVPLVAGPGRFDFGGGGVSTDWPSPATPWLALDRDGNGIIGDATELFGDATPLRAGRTGANGFVPLRELDTDADGRLTARDTLWPDLRLWSDGNGDHVSTPEELGGLAQRGVVWIGLDAAVEPRCDARGNCERERARFGWLTPDGGAEREGAVIDLYLRGQPEQDSQL